MGDPFFSLSDCIARGASRCFYGLLERLDNVKHGLSAGYERRVDAGVERGEPTPVFYSKRQKVIVGEMLGPGQLRMEAVIRQRQVIRPKLMPRCRHQARKHPSRFHGAPKRSRVRWMAENPEEGVLGCRTGSPATSDSLAFKEAHGSTFMHVSGVAQGDEHAGVQERGHERWGWVILSSSSFSNASWTART